MPSPKIVLIDICFLLASILVWVMLETDREWACAMLAFIAGSLSTHHVYNYEKEQND